MKKEFIDLGLSVKWANCNYGTTCEETADTWKGLYCSWGETTSKTHYNPENYDSKKHFYWPNDIRVPSNKEFEELFENTNIESVYDYQNIKDLNGWKFISKINGNHIFFPMTGVYAYIIGYNEANSIMAHDMCFLWTSTIIDRDTTLFHDGYMVELYNVVHKINDISCKIISTSSLWEGQPFREIC